MLVFSEISGFGDANGFCGMYCLSVMIYKIGKALLVEKGLLF